MTMYITIIIIKTHNRVFSFTSEEFDKYKDYFKKEKIIKTYRNC